MFKRTIFTELIAAMLVLPAFATGFGPELSGEQVNACDAEHLGVSFGPTRLKAIWISNVSLDSNIYTSTFDAAGISPTTGAVPWSLYGEYGDLTGVYDSAGNTRHVISVPEMTGYVFDGFYTNKYTGGRKVIDENGVILDAAIEEANKGQTTWYAHWTAKKISCDEGYVYDQTQGQCMPEMVTCEPGEYLPQGARVCVECTENNYCLGGTFYVEPDTDKGINPCESGLVSPAASRRATDCGYIVRIDDNKVYLHAADDDVTHPSFVTEIDGKKWYGDMTKITSTCKKPMYRNTTQTWHVDYLGDEYTVHSRYVQCE